MCHQKSNLQQHSVCTSLTKNVLSASQVADLFNRLFLIGEHTCIFGGANEPLYLPKNVPHCGIIQVISEESIPVEYNRIFYRADYLSSLLHEVAHWCIAGKQRRELIDFGYWYAPDGRDVYQQQNFERVEIKPQALEKIFSEACGIDFNVSVDNLSLPEHDVSSFEAAVNDAAIDYLAKGLPTRAQQFLDGLVVLKADLS